MRRAGELVLYRTEDFLSSVVSFCLTQEDSLGSSLRKANYVGPLKLLFMSFYFLLLFYLSLLPGAVKESNLAQ